MQGCRTNSGGGFQAKQEGPLMGRQEFLYPTSFKMRRASVISGSRSNDTSVFPLLRPAVKGNFFFELFDFLLKSTGETNITLFNLLYQVEVFLELVIVLFGLFAIFINSSVCFRGLLHAGKVLSLWFECLIFLIGKFEITVGTRKRGHYNKHWHIQK